MPGDDNSEMTFSILQKTAGTGTTSGRRINTVIFNMTEYNLKKQQSSMTSQQANKSNCHTFSPTSTL